MTNSEKLEMTAALLGMGSEADVTLLEVYLTAAQREILAWRYSYSANTPNEVPPEYEMTQVYAVIAGYSHAGAEGQLSHSENGISRTFRHEDMVKYIRANVIPLAGVI
ncbi:MAG: phage head-tail connector protein [Clostridia bacterium]|nr:phage head-tail connector protein [Clostridia bacterium]